MSCSNYGTLGSNGACQCPTGLGGSTCSSILCGNPIATQSNRTQLESSAGSTGCSGTNQCTSGFNGLDCNICTSNAACSAAVSAYGTAGDTSSISGGTGLLPDEMLCSSSPFTYTSAFIECGVVNPTLQAVFPGTTTLKFQKNVRPSVSVSDTFGGENTTYAQLWYSTSQTTAPQEQFFCEADTCAQTNDTPTNQINWSCSNLHCTCIPGTSFCGGALDLTAIIDGLSGTLEIDCAANGTDCNFKQATLQSLFGANGLGLSGCSFGECVSSTVVQQYSGTGTSQTSDSGLSGGVIAGLAVVGAILLALASLFVLGFISQKKAREGGRKHLDDVQPAGLSWSDISYTLPSHKGRLLAGFVKRDGASAMSESMSTRGLVAHEKAAEASNRATVGKHGKLILDGITGSIPYGGLMAILGPSGAGKSTFVDILAGKRKAGQVAGGVQLLTKNPGAVRIGYVDQADVLPANLTVREALIFAAKLKLPESIPVSEKEDRVWEVLGQLGLRDIAGSRIGDGERRGISGGERRRTSIGLELIARPSILILDEPTSGLDSVSAARVVQVLRDLAHGEHGVDGRTTIVATIHQPSSQIFHAFDSVLLLSSRGTQVYFGSAKDASAHFGQLGYPCPQDWNPADHLLEMVTTEAVVSLAPRRSAPSPSFQKDTGNGNGNSFDMAPMMSKSDSNEAAYPPAIQSYDSKSATAVKRRNAKPSATRLTQFQVLSHREFLNLKRDRSLIVFHNLVAAIVGVFVGGLYFKVDITISGFQNRIGSLFFLGALIAFSALSALSNLIIVRALFLRERASSYYGPVMWMLSRVVWDIIPLRILPTLLLGTITYWMVGLSKDAAHFFKFLLILVEYSAAITLFNLLLAMVIPQPGVAILVSNVLNLAQLAYAGFFVNLSKIPAVLRWIQWLNPLKYALEALAVNEVSGGLLISDKLQGVPVQVNAQLIMTLLFGFKANAYYRDVLVLFGWTAFFGICLILAVLRMREIR